MVTKPSTESSTSSSTTPEPVGIPPVRRLSEPQVVEKVEASAVTDSQAEDQAGVVGDIVNSILEPGTNATIVIAMNVSFFFLIMILAGLGAMTNWMGEVIFLLVTSILLWGAMVLFVLQMQKIQNNPENMPINDPLLDTPGASEVETKKDK